MPNRTSESKRETAKFFADDDAKMRDEYSRVSTKLRHPRTKTHKGQRSYPGYDDTSREGRAQIRAFNRAGGPEFLNDDTDAGEYKAAAQYALDERNKAGKKSEPARGRAKKSEPKTMREAIDKGIDEADDE